MLEMMSDDFYEMTDTWSLLTGDDHHELDFMMPEGLDDDTDAFSRLARHGHLCGQLLTSSHTPLG